MNKPPVKTKIDEYYTNLFTQNPSLSTPFPDVVETRRWSKISEYLSYISKLQNQNKIGKLRILDVGCGRGWLANMASAYGLCDGIDPVAGSIQHAKYMFPNLHFHIGELPNLLDNPDFVPYDVVISTEVIEHVIDKCSFVSAIAESLLPHGYAIITTPRGELFKKYTNNYEKQPVEDWLTEKDLRKLFEQHGFIAISKDRAYEVLPMLSLFHRLCASRKLSSLMDDMGIFCIHKAMEHIASIYQIWLFKKKS